MGEEIGMLDPDYSSMDDYVDIESLNAYQKMLDEGKSQEEAFSIIRAKSRDNSRVPMQWDDSTNAGFSESTPWLKVGKSYKEINVAKEKTGLIFTFYQELIRLRKQLPIIADGNYKAAFKDNEKVYAFERHLDKEKLLVLNNFFAEKVKIKLPENYLQGQVLLSNYKDVTLDETVTLQPYQTLAILVS